MSGSECQWLHGDLLQGLIQVPNQGPVDLETDLRRANGPWRHPPQWTLDTHSTQPAAVTHHSTATSVALHNESSYKCKCTLLVSKSTIDMAHLEHISFRRLEALNGMDSKAFRRICPSCTA